jgi:hypothetical protein
MDYTLSTVALDTEEAALLPAREVLGFINVASITAANGAWAVNGLSLFSSATAGAAQTVVVSQH